MTPITCEVQLTADDYLAALRLHRRRVYWFGRFRWLFWTVFLFLVIAFGLMGSGSSAWSTPVLLVLFVGAMWLVTERVMLPRQARRIYRQQQSLQRPYRVTIADEGTEAVSSTSRGRHAWSDYQKWIEGPDQFLLYLSDIMFVIIPKRSVARPDDLREVLGRNVRRSLLTLVLCAAICGSVLGAQRAVGVFAADTDVGRARGFVAYNAQQQTYLVSGSGQNMWDVRDDFHFVWKRISGNFILATRARFIGAGVEEHRKIGWTIRPSLDPGSAHVTAALHGNGLMSLQFRRQTGAITEEARSADSLPDADVIIQLERRDGEYFMSVAQFGDTLVTQRLAGVSLPDSVYVGLFVCSHNAAVTERAVFRNVRITVPAQRN